jgi:hypothetical protein
VGGGFVTSRVGRRERWNPPWTPARAKKVARITALVLACTWLFYVIAGNLLIKTNALAWLLSKPGEVEVDWVSASTWWPGRYHVEGFRLRTHDSHVEMQLKLDDVHLNLGLPGLISKHMHFTRVEGDGLSLRIRQRLDPDRATPARLALLPDIEGFANPPIKDPVLKPQTRGEDAIVRIEDIDVTRAREVWIDEMRYTGDLHVKGAFYFQPQKRLAIDGAHLEVNSGAVHMGKNPVMVALAGTIDCAVQPFDVKYPEGAEILGNFDFGVHLDGRLEDMRWASFFVNGEGSGGAAKRASIALLSGGPGALHLHVAVFHGVLKAGTTAEIESKGLALELGGHTFTTSVLAKIAVKDPIAPATKASMTASVSSPFAVRVKGRQDAIVNANKAAILATSHELDLARGFSDIVFSADLDETSFDVPSLDPYVGSSDLHVASGKGTLKAHVDLDPKADLWKGESTVRVEKLGVHYKGKPMSGTLETHIVMPKAHAGVVDLSGSSLDVKDASIGSSRGWWGHVDLAKAEARDGPVAFVADLKSRGRDVRPLLAFFPVDLPSWVSGILDLDGLAGTMKLRLGDDLVAVENLAGKGGDFTIEGSYLQKANAKGGAFLVSWHMLTVGVDIRGDVVGLVPLGASSWYRDRARVR